MTKRAFENRKSSGSIDVQFDDDDSSTTNAQRPRPHRWRDRTALVAPPPLSELATFEPRLPPSSIPRPLRILESDDALDDVA